MDATNSDRTVSLNSPLGDLGVSRIYLKIALHSLLKNKFYTVLNLSGTALTFIFISVVAIYFRQTTGNYPPEVYKDRTIQVSDILLENGKSVSVDSSLVSYYSRLKEPEYIAFFNWQSPFIFNGYKVIWTPAGYVNSDFFNIFHFRYFAGRPFNKNDEEKNDPVLVMSKEYAAAFFGKPDVLGNKIEIQGNTYSIIGIYEKPNIQMRFSDNDLYIPRAFNTYMPQGDTSHDVYLKAKDKGHVNTMSDELNRLHRQFFQQGTINSSPVIKKWNTMKEDVSQKFYISLSLALLFLLLIPAFNILSLNTGKIIDQMQETAIKRAYGATQLTILRDIFLENTLLALTGSFIGLLLTYPVLSAINSFINKYSDTKASLTAHIDLPVVAAILLLTLIFSLLSCYIPAHKVISSNITEELKGGNNE